MGLFSLIGRIATTVLGFVGVMALYWLDGKGLYVIFLILSLASSLFMYKMPYCTLGRPLDTWAVMILYIYFLSFKVSNCMFHKDKLWYDSYSYSNKNKIKIMNDIIVKVMKSIKDKALFKADILNIVILVIFLKILCLFPTFEVIMLLIIHGINPWRNSKILSKLKPSYNLLKLLDHVCVFI
jgi:hypothetical protein